MEKFFNKQAGFTIVETLVALAIFSMSVITLLSVLGDGIRDTNYAKQKITAGYLAQEAIEYLRNMRDTAVLYSATPQQGWDAWITKMHNGNCDTATGCFINDMDMFSVSSMPSLNGTYLYSCAATCPNMVFNDSIGKYNYSSGNPTNFSRKITVVQISNNEVEVTSTATWTQGALTRSISVSENLYNWIE